VQQCVTMHLSLLS